jgi:hypothetical protein
MRPLRCSIRWLMGARMNIAADSVTGRSRRYSAETSERDSWRDNPGRCPGATCPGWGFMVIAICRSACSRDHMK